MLTDKWPDQSAGCPLNVCFQLGGELTDQDHCNALSLAEEVKWEIKENIRFETLNSIKGLWGQRIFYYILLKEDSNLNPRTNVYSMRKGKDEIEEIKKGKVRWKNALQKFPDFNMLAVGKIGSG